MRISDWSSDVCSSDLPLKLAQGAFQRRNLPGLLLRQGQRLLGLLKRLIDRIVAVLDLAEQLLAGLFKALLLIPDRNGQCRSDNQHDNEGRQPGRAPLAAGRGRCWRAGGRPRLDRKSTRLNYSQ